jgi:hypothetical protein
VTDVNEDPDNMTVTIDEDIPENNSALQNQNTENMSDEEEDGENLNDPDLVQAFLKKWWVESDFKTPNLPLSCSIIVFA